MYPFTVLTGKPKCRAIAVGPLPSFRKRQISSAFSLLIMVMASLSVRVIAGAAAELAMGVPIAAEHRPTVLAGDRVIRSAGDQLRVAVPILHPAAVRAESSLVPCMLFNVFPALGTEQDSTLGPICHGR